jgi:hypothetical protein
MTASRSKRLACGLAALVAAALMVLPARGDLKLVEDERERRRKALLEGTHFFRHILHDRGMTAIKEEDFGLLEEKPDRCIVIVLGNLDWLGSLPGGVEKFVRSGGALLAASDRPIMRSDAGPRSRRTAAMERANEGLRAVAGVSINQGTVVCARGADCYRGLDFCPFLEPVTDTTPALFAGLPPMARVATNVPSYLILRREVAGIEKLATLPPGSRVDSGRGFRLGTDLGGPIIILDGNSSMGAKPEENGEPPLLFAVGGKVGQGRVLVMADHSLFINEMMRPTDTANVEFTYNCIDWLSENKKRTHVLFVEDGRIQSKFDVPMKSVRIPMEELIDLLYAKRNEILVERGVVQLEQDDFFNRTLVEALDDHGLTRDVLLRYFALLGTAALLVYALVRLGIRQRFRHDTSTPLLAADLGRKLPARPLVEQRTEELIQHGNLWDPASVLVRHWFARMGIEAPAPAAPAFAASGGWWRRRRVLKRLARLWLLANGREPKRISPPEVWRLQRDLDALRKSWERGEWGVGRSA